MRFFFPLTADVEGLFPLSIHHPLIGKPPSDNMADNSFHWQWASPTTDCAPGTITVIGTITHFLPSIVTTDWFALLFTMMAQLLPAYCNTCLFAVYALWVAVYLAIYYSIDNLLFIYCQDCLFCLHDVSSPLFKRTIDLYKKKIKLFH